MQQIILNIICIDFLLVCRNHSLNLDFVIETRENTKIRWDKGAGAIMRDVRVKQFSNIFSFPNNY